MSRRQRFGIGILVVLVPVLVVFVVGAVWLYVTLRPLGEFLDHGLLGPEDQRQRIEVPAHGFAIPFAADWVIETPAPDPLDVERLGMTAVLVSTAPEDGPVCTVYVAPGAATVSVERLLRPLAAEYGMRGDYGSTSGWDMPDGAVGTTFENDTGPHIAAWFVPHGDDAHVLSCVVSAESRNDFDGGASSRPPALLTLGMPPIVRSIEILPPSSPAPTPRALGQGGRVEMPEAGFALTFPESWIVLEPGTADFERALAHVDIYREELHTGVVAGAGPSEQEGGPPVEWCTVDAMIFPASPLDAWIKWKEDASLEDIVPLLFVGMGDADQPGISYLELPVGQAARMDVSDEATYLSVYLLRDGNTFYWISCAGDDPPGDRWLSIAETFELLPAEE